VVKLIESDRVHGEQLMLASAKARSDIAAQVQAHQAREQLLMAQAQRDIDAAHTELKAQLLQMVNQEQTHSANILRLHEDLRQQLNAQSRASIERENSLRIEFAAQISSQHDAFEENKDAALKREHEFSNALNAEKQARDLLDVQVNDIKREVAKAHAQEHVLRQNINSYVQQIASHQAEISFIRDTLSWRLTSPLRRIAGWIGWAHPQHEMRLNPSEPNAPFLDSTIARVTDTAPSVNPADLLLPRNNVGPQEPSNLICCSPENSMTNIIHVNQLLELHDITFVRAAYQCLLGRDTDDAGEGFYVARLRGGIAKADIIFEILQSDEGKRAGAKLAGLREFVAAHPPVRGWGFRSTVARLTRIEQQVNRLENQLATANAEYSQTAKVIEEKLQNLESLLHTFNDTNERRMKQMELTRTAPVNDSNRQIVAALDSRFVPSSEDVGRRSNQIEATATNLHESVVRQTSKVLELLPVQRSHESQISQVAQIAPFDNVPLEEQADGLKSGICAAPAEIDRIALLRNESVVAITEFESGTQSQGRGGLANECLCLETDRSTDEASWLKYLEGIFESRLISPKCQTRISPAIGSLIVVVDCSGTTCTQDEWDRTRRCLSVSLVSNEYPMKVVWFDPANELARAGISGVIWPNSSFVSDRHELQLLGADDDVFLVLKPGDEVHPELHMALDYFGAFSADFILIDMYFKERNRIYPFLLHAVDTTHATFCDYFLGRYAANGQLFKAALKGGGSENLGALGRGICTNLDLKGGAIALHIALPLLHIRTSNSELAQLRIAVIVEHTGPIAELQLGSGANSKTRDTPRTELTTVRPKVSVVICTKDCGLLLRQLLKRLELEPLIDDIIIVSNNTTNVYALTTLVTALASAKVKILSYAGPFNFSRQCNLGESHTKNEILLFLNDDIAPITNDWLERLYAWMAEPRIVGPMLIYPNESVQHAGMFLGFHGVAGHLLRHSKLPSGDYGFMLTAPRKVSCLTGAALMMPKRVFAALNGFDPLLGTYLQDVDISLRALNSGVDLVLDPRSILMHMESISVLPKLSDNRIMRTRELEFSHFHQRWGHAVKRDLWVNPLFSADNESLTLLRA